MKDKWFPCICTIILGALVIVFTWWTLPWSRWALTVLGALVILKGLINKCCGQSIASRCKEEVSKEMSEQSGGRCCS